MYINIAEWFHIKSSLRVLLNFNRRSIRPVGSDHLSNWPSDSHTYWRTRCTNAVLQGSHLEAVYRWVWICIAITTGQFFFFLLCIFHCSSSSYSEDLSWVPAETLAEGPTPEARIGHTATYDPDSKRIFVFGGSKHKKWFNDVHILDTQSWRWTMVEVLHFQNFFYFFYF